MADRSTSVMAPPPSSLPRSNLPILYYGLVVVGTAAIVLALYNFIILKWCREAAPSGPRHRPMAGPSASRNRNFGSNLVSSFKYKKDVEAPDVCSDYECAVCLSDFEEGEEMRQMPNCKHSFHAACIDLWLHSHLECPLCRSPVEPPAIRQNTGKELDGASQVV